MEQQRDDGGGNPINSGGDGGVDGRRRSSSSTTNSDGGFYLFDQQHLEGYDEDGAATLPSSAVKLESIPEGPSSSSPFGRSHMTVKVFLVIMMNSVHNVKLGQCYLSAQLRSKEQVNRTLQNFAESMRNDDEGTFKSQPIYPDGVVGDAFPLFDADGRLSVSSPAELAERLGLSLDEARTRVVCVVGNAGEGKSHALNQVFFDGQRILDVSNQPENCTRGIQAIFAPFKNAVLLDTEGLTGPSEFGNANHRKRLILKMMSLSDVVIFKSRAEHLPDDGLRHLGDASEAHIKYFSAEIRRASQGDQSGALSDAAVPGPCVFIYHKPKDKEVLPRQDLEGRSPEDRILERMAQMGLDMSGFRRTVYFGASGPDEKQHTEELAALITEELESPSGEARGQRSLTEIFQEMEALSKAFNDRLGKEVNGVSFVSEHLSCAVRCLVCGRRCGLARDHGTAGAGSGHTQHETRGGDSCVYDQARKNHRFSCRLCKAVGRHQVMVLKATPANESTFGSVLSYVTSGYVLECPTHRVVYREYSNPMVRNPPPTQHPDVSAEVVHVWPGDNELQGTRNAGQLLVDNINSLSLTVSSYTSEPVGAITSSVKGMFRPKSWVPDEEAFRCYDCRRDFDDVQRRKHHCRSCGKVFCLECSQYTRPVRHYKCAQRSCKRCFEIFQRTQCDRGEVDTDPADVTARELSDSLSGGVGALLGGTRSAVVNSVRPDYWQPDEHAHFCPWCRVEFGQEVGKHHCRACGKVVCHACSKSSMKVPSRGWDVPVRVCDRCCE